MIIAHNLDMTQPAVSQHLKVLKNCGLLTSGRRGSMIHYRINITKFYELKSKIDKFAEKINVTQKDEDVCKDPVKPFPARLMRKFLK